jgi:tyrosyl-tRNA synthetase
VLTTPILEGLDGVQKMSKSLGNAIGIHEPPLEIYGKIMSVSDEIMWRYYELLTDVSIAEIENMRRESHPMQAKKDLARRIVADFHSTDVATKAGEDWAKQFQKDEVPENVRVILLKYSDVAPVGLESVGPGPGSAGPGLTGISRSGDPVPVKLDKLLVRCGFSSSTSDGQRKIKQRAVRINGEITTEHVLKIHLPTELTIRIGRSICKASIG